jgi:hypothetical protein
MAYQIKRTEKEIAEVIAKAIDAECEGLTKWPRLTFEQGILQTLAWLFGDADESPMEG